MSCISSDRFLVFGVNAGEFLDNQASFLSFIVLSNQINLTANQGITCSSYAILKCAKEHLLRAAGSSHQCSY